MSDEQKFCLLSHVWKPPHDFNFPSNSSSRKFQPHWFKEFPWLAYSKRFDGVFCMHCVLFANIESSRNAAKLGQLYSSTFNTWSKALKKFRDHAKISPMHQTSTLRATHFRQCMQQKTLPINVQINMLLSQKQSKVATNCRGCHSLWSTEYCPAWPQRWFNTLPQRQEQSWKSTGNLQEILKFIAKCGNNSDFEEHIASAPKNATYRSKTTQNQIIKICGEEIIAELCREIKAAKLFSVLADEAAGVSNVEQMPLVLRFVDSESRIREEFFGFIACDTGVIGKAIARKILWGVRHVGLDLSLCRGQGYDGAGNMAGKCSGAAATIQKKYPKALYVHCASHALNLCVASACNIQIVSNLITILTIGNLSLYLIHYII